METLNTQDKSAFAIISVMLLAAAISTGSLLLRAESKPNPDAHRFVGTMPEATSVEELPPTF
jgi:hypothetical protein